MNLQDFLNANPVDDLTEDVTISPRFKDNEGKTLKFTIKAMSPDDFEAIRKKATQLRKGKKVEFDNQLFNLSIAINHTVNPNFKDAESIKKLGLKTPEEYIQKVLLAGELTTLVTEINKLSGFDVEMNELVDEVKN